MRRLLVLAAVGTLAALAATAPAAAKGPSAASVTGPGLDHPLPVKGEGEWGVGTPLGSLVQFGGFFSQVFGQSPDTTTTTRTRPAGDLGPSYRVRYRMPGPDRVSTIVQDVYPYAKPRPVTYMRADQRFWSGMRTKGGWYVARAALRSTLVKAGLPKSPASGSGGGSVPWAWTGAGIVAVFLLVLAVRRRSVSLLRTLRTSA